MAMAANAVLWHWGGMAETGAMVLGITTVGAVLTTLLGVLVGSILSSRRHPSSGLGIGRPARVRGSCGSR